MTPAPPRRLVRDEGTFLLDTDTLSVVVLEPSGTVADRIAEVGEERVFTSLVVAGELRYGAARSGSPALGERVRGLLARIRIAPLETPVERHYAEIRTRLAGAGTPIGPNDLWIAAHGRALGATVVTGNEREYRRVPGLQVVNWLGS